MDKTVGIKATSIEGVEFLLFPDDAFPELRTAMQNLEITHATVPLGYLLGTLELEPELEYLENRIKSILNDLPLAVDYELDDISMLIAELRETAMARKLLRVIQDGMVGEPEQG